MLLNRSIVTLGLFLTVYLSTLIASTPIFNEPPPLNMYLDGGYREDWLKFHIGGDRPCSKNFSHVEWRNLKIAQISGSINYSTCHNYYMRANGGYGRIMQGSGTITNQWLILRRPQPLHENHKHKHKHKHHHKHHDDFLDISEDEILERFKNCCHLLEDRSDDGCCHLFKECEEQLDCSHCSGECIDHEPDGRHLLRRCFRHDHHHRQPLFVREHSKQKANANDGSVCDLAGGLGWKVISGGGRGWIAGLIGYSYESQNVQMKNFRQEHDSLEQIVPEALIGLKGSYKTRWTGPFVGVDFAGRVECNVFVFGSAEWHICDFRGEGSWKRHTAYHAKFRHHARGYGAVGTLGFDWAPCDHWGFGLIANYQQWSTRKGNNHARVRSLLYPTSNLPKSFPIAHKSRLYRVKWITWSLSLVSTYRF